MWTNEKVNEGQDKLKTVLSTRKSERTLGQMKNFARYQKSVNC